MYLPNKLWNRIFTFVGNKELFNGSLSNKDFNYITIQLFIMKKTTNIFFIMNFIENIESLNP